MSDSKPIASLHADLVARGVRWLRSQGCRVVLSDPFRAAVWTGEQPDVIGWRDGHSILLEAKASRADFLADRNKRFRKEPTLGMGDFRLYIAPPGVIAASDLPEGWGLLIAHERRIEVAGSFPRQYEWNGRKRVSWHPAPFEGNKRCETVMLVSALAQPENRAPITRRGVSTSNEPEPTP